MTGETLRSCNISLTLSMGAVIVREKIAAIAPAVALRKALLEILTEAESFGDDGEEFTAALVATTTPKYGISDDGTFVFFSVGKVRLDELWYVYSDGINISTRTFCSWKSFRSILGRFMIIECPESFLRGSDNSKRLQIWQSYLSCWFATSINTKSNSQSNEDEKVERY